METGSQVPGGLISLAPGRRPPSNLRDAEAVADLFLGMFRRDLQSFYPQAQVEPRDGNGRQPNVAAGPEFRLIRGEGGDLAIDLFGVRYGLVPREGSRFTAQDRRMIAAFGAVLSLRYQHLFQINHSTRLELYRGGSEDHYVAAFVEPSVYEPAANRPSRIAATIHTLRTTALSTYENRRVSTGVLLLGPDGDPDRPTPPDALTYGVELTALKSIHRLCDGKRTLFQVDAAGRLAHVVDVRARALEVPSGSFADSPCARDYMAHAWATRSGGHVCLVLSPNQEIKLFAEGSQAFAFAHGRWRILDPATKYAAWSAAVADPKLARVLFQTALDLAECRQGGLFVVVEDTAEIVGRLVSPHDLLAAEAADGPPAEFNPGDPLAKRALHYLARGRAVTDLEPPILEALAAIDGALVIDQKGRLHAFGAILRQDASAASGPVAEGARTTAAIIASRFGPVLKISEDGIVSCFLNGSRVWDL